MLAVRVRLGKLPRESASASERTGRNRMDLSPPGRQAAECHGCGGKLRKLPRAARFRSRISNRLHDMRQGAFGRSRVPTFDAHAGVGINRWWHWRHLRGQAAACDDGFGAPSGRTVHKDRDRAAAIAP